MKNQSIVRLVVAGVMLLGALAGQGDRSVQAQSDVTYTLEAVGGRDQTLTFVHEDIDGFSLGSTSARSDYPLGMVFTLRPSSPNGPVEDVILFLRYAHGSGTRVTAAWDESAQAWVANPWPSGGQPAWTHFDFYWRVRDVTGASVDSVPQPVDYYDPARHWFRMESPYIIVYWCGLSEDDPDRFARAAAEAVAATQPRREQGFGQSLSYKSEAVIYDSRQMLSAMYGSGVSDPTAGGFTSSELGMSVQYASGGGVAPQIAWLQHVITHELVHLYQYDVIGGATGPNWWVEGQAEWFGYAPRGYDERLITLAKLQDLPTLSREITRNTIQADGLPYLVYDMGASFVNWFVNSYGLDAHAQVVALMKQNTGLYDALEQVTGQPFLDLENTWRSTIGAPPLALADIDPAAALEPPVAAQFAPGDVLTLPPDPVMVPLYEAPGPRVLVDGVCFAGMDITILQAGSLAGLDYYQVDCRGMIGWLPSSDLANAG